MKNENTIVTSLISREQAQMEEMMEKTFQGYISAFLAAFSRSRNLTAEEAEQLTKMVDEFGEA